MTSEVAVTELDRLSATVLERCDVLAALTDEPGWTTRFFLGPATHLVHDLVARWMTATGLTPRLDAVGNLAGRRAGSRLVVIGSHLDTAPHAGRYDGILGVLLGLAVAEALADTPLPFGLEVIGFSEEEGIRFRYAHIGSLAVCGRLDGATLDRLHDGDGVNVADAIRRFGLDPTQLPTAAYQPGELLAFLEPHIEQGPVLDDAGLSLGVVTGIVGAARFRLTFRGEAGHAGTQPMARRRDALTAAVPLVVAAECLARATPGLVATVGQLVVVPGAVNVVPGAVELTLDVRHPVDVERDRAAAMLLNDAEATARERGVILEVERSPVSPAVAFDPALVAQVQAAAEAEVSTTIRLASGAGHDAAIMAGLAPTAMLFLRSPGGISHNPAEAVRPEDVRSALGCLVRLILELAREHG